ncbi:thymidylate synthase (FAD) [Anaerosolibacter carboniphilus]|uniref:Flavin-dependent thymidylate synthase n=1 Tax=Anaerosolibacter carboniphilus TaxID=1417629 RepID=A0A841KYG7_9FIRM|nr:FAD-dependent thymidylate synthase [Anaerosolibacter carboniphilus]MBB6215175.1 thymidylate synthase (FAD) [Anaerosolibacter carboniphilus]
MGAKLKVELLRHTPDAEKLIAAAAKLCYSPIGIDKIEDKLTEESATKFLNMLMSMGHESPVEHVSFTFGIEGVSRVLTHQLVRHRVGASYSQQSQRYVRLEQFEYIIPPAIDRNPKARETFIKAMEDDQRCYNELTEILMEENYHQYVEEGLSEKAARSQAEKKSIEDARYVFPNACETKIVFTMNARGLFNFFNLRCCNRAQWEIRELATEMLRLVRQVAPTLFKYSGPNCLNEPCPEGNMTCGKIKEVRERFGNL